MRPFLALIKASFHQALDQKVFWILVGLSTLVILATASLHFGEDRLSVLFGLTSIGYRAPEATGLSGRDVAGFLTLYTTVMMIPGFGFLLAIIFTAGFIPALMRRGLIDVYLSRAVSRRTLVLGAYAGGLLYAFLNVAWFFTGLWIALNVAGLSIGPTFLLLIPLVTAAYAILYAFAAFIGFTLRSTVAAILITLGLWVVSNATNALELLRRGVTSSGGPDRETFGGVIGSVIHVAYLILPKVEDVDVATMWILGKLMGRGHDKLIASLGNGPGSLDPAAHDWLLSAGTNLAFIVLMLGLSSLVMRRRDF